MNDQCVKWIYMKKKRAALIKKLKFIEFIEQINLQ